MLTYILFHRSNECWLIKKEWKNCIHLHPDLFLARLSEFPFIHHSLESISCLLSGTSKLSLVFHRIYLSAAFHIVAISLAQHGACSCTPLKYTHIDLHGHLPKPHHLPYSGNPVLALSYCYLIQGKCLTVRNDLPFEMQYVCEVDCKPVCLPVCQPCQPCQPCVPEIKRVPCPPGTCSCCPPCVPCPPCAPPPCDPCCQPVPCPPCPIPCQEPINVIEPMCRPNVQKRIC
ncbi:uncharacterized protein LOC143183354 [Calliopsis andreniformis]|uniref:uncharacterized protein LOC143183354 n=1 Tax=Calliopsis andreniformis TaxID=337506 RepID=UPI003FCEA283